LKYVVIKRTRFYSVFTFVLPQAARYVLSYDGPMTQYFSTHVFLFRPLSAATATQPQPPHGYNFLFRCCFVIVGFYLFLYFFSSFIICERKLEYLSCFVDQFCHDFIVRIEIRNKSCVVLRQLFSFVRRQRCGENTVVDNNNTTDIPFVSCIQ
jgi:hypothetical protein